MSIQSEITRISGNVADALTAIAAKGVTVPSGSNSDDLADLIAQITGGSSSGVVITDTLDAAGGTIRTITAIETSGTKSITANGTGIDVTGYAAVDVAVPTGTSAPTFTAIWDDDYTEIQSISCNMSFAECAEYYSNLDKTFGIYIEKNEAETDEYNYPLNATSLSGSPVNTINLTVIAAGVPVLDLAYHNDGTIDHEDPSSLAHTLTAAANGTYTPEDGVYTSVVVNVPPASLQTKTHITPTTSSQTISPDAGYDGLSSVQIDPIPSQYIVPTGTKSITANGTGIDVAAYSAVDVAVPTGPAKAIQVYSGYASRTANSYGATDVTLTVAKTGTYKITWCAARGSSSGTMGTRLRINSTDGAAQQTWTGTYWQCITLTNQTLNKDDVLTVYATSGSTTRSVYVGNLIIEEL